MRTKHTRPEGPQQAPIHPVAARPVPGSPPTPGGPMPPLPVRPRAGSPRELDPDSSLCLGTTLSIPSDGGDQDATPHRLPIGTTLQRYVLLERVGAGAMGVVFAAYDFGLDRKVALKLLREPRNSVGQRKRLMREAQALARLSHPNVVAVHDIGTHDDQVFIAMEYVDGRTLRRWCEEERRSWREVLAVFRAAGEGLAAAHAAGIVHRDFKPDNVLVDRQGRVRVSDFGLAKVAPDPTKPTGTTAQRPTANESSAGDQALTRTGTFFGTPAYMALEQHRCEREIDPRADQFSFAVALYEAACGVHPFEADTPIEIADNIQHGRIHAPRRRVPGWLVRALLPALAAEPAQRYSSMTALLRKLRDRRPSHIAAVAGLVAIGLGAGLVIVASNGLPLVSVDAPVVSVGPGSAPNCQDAERKLGGVWDRARQQEIEKAFKATGSPLADKAWARVERELDRYAAKWAEMRTEACEATHVRHEHSEEVLDRRMVCLNDRLTALRELGHELVKTSSKTIELAAQAAQSLRSLDGCANIAGLLQEVQPPDAAAQDAVTQLRARDAHLRARLATGQVADALPEGRKLVADATALGYPPVRAEALLTLGGLQWAHSNFSAAANSYLDAVEAAEAGGAQRIAVESLLELLWVVGDEQGRYTEARPYAQLARGKIASIRDDRLEALLEDSQGVMWLKQKQLARARPHLERGRELYLKVHGPNSHQYSASLEHFGMLAQAEHRFDDAVRLFRSARQIAEDVHGFEHSATLTYLADEARALYQADRYDEAFQINQRGYEFTKADHIVGVSFRVNRGLIEWKRKQYDQARDHLAKALATIEKYYGRDHAYVAETAVDLARVLVDMGRPADAMPYLTRAAAVYERSFGAEHPDLATALVELGRAHLTAGKPTLAAPVLEQALSIRERTAAAATEIEEVRSLMERARRTP